ncbi:MAG TPA: hypothetical protein VGK67_06385 [Myxococcales bacterium]|jgi:hypothetical protein
MHASLLFAFALAAAPTVQDFVDGAEIGDAEHFVAFDTAGRFRSELIEKAGKTRVTGTWSLKGDTATVKASGCTGPSCKDLKKDFTAKVAVTADRAMVVQSDAPGELLKSGSYYCRLGGCEKRIGVVVEGKDAKPRTLNYLLDYLIDQNRKRDVTVVWIGPTRTADAGKTRLEYCTRQTEIALKGALQVAGDLELLKWVGKLEPTASEEKGCLWDVRLVVADDVAVPAKQRP